MKHPKCVLTVALFLTGAAGANSQTPAEPQQAPAVPATPPSPFTRWGTDFTFLFDGYVDKNFNDPPSGFNQLRNFDMRADTAHFNMGMLTVDRAPAPVGFHVDAGFGQIFDVIHGADKAPRQLNHVMQAYVSVKPSAWHGLELDAGEFVTAAGAEVIQANQNWNYSRSLLFALAIPYYHFGVRASFPVGPHFTGGVQLVNGWNNVKDNNSGKTLGVYGSYAWKKVTWTGVYYGGPEKDHTNTGWRQLYDTTLAFTPTEKLSAYVNFDYGRDKSIGPGAQQWTGVAGAARYTFCKNCAIAARLEWFNDMDGFSTGAAQSLKEATLTGEYKFFPWLLARMEFRDDWSNQPFFQTSNGTSRSQPTALLGMVAVFGPKR